MKEYRVYGPPGTGKTTFLTGEVERVAAEIGGHNIMVASYTTTAAAEVSSRANLPENNIGTIHKFAYEAIGRPPVVEDKVSKLKEWNEYAPEYSLTLNGCKDIQSGLELSDGDTLGDQLMAQVTVLRNRLVPREMWPSNARNFFNAWSQWKRSIASIDYTDMLERAYEEADHAPSNPQIIYVDEAQDCTALQFRLLTKWSKHADALVMVGDDDQCIYQFAGATPEAFAVGQLTENDMVLDQSYRIPYLVWEHATNWIAKIPDRVEKPYSPKISEDVGFVRRLPYSYKNGKEMVENVIYKSMERGLSVMVIAPCSYMVESIRMSLIAQGIPYHNPYRMIRADWNPLKLANGTTYAQRLKAFYGPRLAQISRRNWWTPAELKAFASVLAAKGVFNKGMKGKLDDEDLKEVNVETLFKYFTEEAVNKILTNDVDWWKENLVNEDARKKADYPLQIVDKFGPDFLDADEITPPVIIGTIHSVKGGEADVVIVIPDLSLEGMQEWTGKGKAAIRRLFYVAVTRAKHGVFIAKPAGRFFADI